MCDKRLSFSIHVASISWYTFPINWKKTKATSLFSRTVPCKETMLCYNVFFLLWAIADIWNCIGIKLYVRYIYKLLKLYCIFYRYTLNVYTEHITLSIVWIEHSNYPICNIEYTEMNCEEMHRGVYNVRDEYLYPRIIICIYIG